MTNYRAYQQLAPVQISQEPPEQWESRLREVGVVSAECGEAAIDEAKKLTAFRVGRGLGRYPIVEKVTSGNPRQGEPVQ